MALTIFYNYAVLNSHHPHVLIVARLSWNSACAKEGSSYVSLHSRPREVLPSLLEYGTVYTSS